MQALATQADYDKELAAQTARSVVGVSWSPTLPIELALKTASPREIQQAYKYSDEEWARLPKNPVFMADLAAACELVKQEGMSFKLKAKILSEEFLKEVFQMVHAKGDKAVPPSVKADLIKAVTRWAGYEPKGSDVVGNNGAVQANTLNIQINLKEGYAALP